MTHVQKGSNKSEQRPRDQESWGRGTLQWYGRLVVGVGLTGPVGLEGPPGEGRCIIQEAPRVQRAPGSLHEVQRPCGRSEPGILRHHEERDASLQ